MQGLNDPNLGFQYDVPDSSIAKQMLVGVMFPLAFVSGVALVRGMQCLHSDVPCELAHPSPVRKLGCAVHRRFSTTSSRGAHTCPLCADPTVRWRAVKSIRMVAE